MFYHMTQLTQVLHGVPLPWHSQTFIQDRSNFVTLILFLIKSRQVASYQSRMTILRSFQNHIVPILI